jgi:hypothetical protein
VNVSFFCHLHQCGDGFRTGVSGDNRCLTLYSSRGLEACFDRFLYLLLSMFQLYRWQEGNVSNVYSFITVIGRGT